MASLGDFHGGVSSSFGFDDLGIRLGVFHGGVNSSVSFGGVSGVGDVGGLGGGLGVAGGGLSDITAVALVAI